MMSISLSLATLALLYFVNSSNNAATPNRDNEEMPKPNSMADNPLTSHILDTTFGLPAQNVKCILYKMTPQGSWAQIIERNTDSDGRIKNLLTDAEFTPGVYKFYFDTKAYYDKLNTKTFYPFVEIVFEIVNPNQHYHVPLLLSPYGFSTYRGS